MSGTFPAEAVDHGLSAVNMEGMFVPEMCEDLRHERAVHVDQLPASAAFEMEMQAASGVVVLIIRAFAASAGKFFEFALGRKGGKGTENGRFSGVYLSDEVTRGKTAVPVLREKAQDPVPLYGAIRYFFCHENSPEI